MDVEEDEVEQTCHKRAQNSKRVRRAHVTAAREATREAEDSAPKRKAAPTSSGNCDNTVYVLLSLGACTLLTVYRDTILNTRLTFRIHT